MQTHSPSGLHADRSVSMQTHSPSGLHADRSVGIPLPPLLLNDEPPNQYICHTMCTFSILKFKINIISAVHKTLLKDSIVIIREKKIIPASIFLGI